MIDPSITITFPPMASCTASPPVGLAALFAYLKKQAINAEVRDLNIEFFEYCMRNWAFVRETLEEQCLRAIGDSANAQQKSDAILAKYLYLPLAEMLREKISERREEMYRILRILIGIIYLGNVYKNENYLWADFSSLDKLANRICEDAIFQGFLENSINHTSRIVGFSILAETQLPFAIAFSRMLRHRVLSSITVAGGPYITEIYRYPSSNCLFGDFDYLIPHEGESALCELIRCVNSMGTPQHPNLYTLNDHFLKDPLKEDLDCLPAPDYTTMPLYSYQTNDLSLAVYSSKGCSWRKCTFCSNMNLEYREKNIDLFIAELERVSNQTSIRHFQFTDENIPPYRLERFSRTLIERKLKFRWYVQIRFTTELDAALLALMKDAGCYAIEFGLESGNQEVLNKICKGINLETVQEILRNCSSLGLEVILNCMIGFPEESFEQAEETVSFVSSLIGVIPRLNYRCNTQFVKIYRSSRYFAKYKFGITSHFLSPVAEWKGANWLNRFKEKYGNHPILTGDFFLPKKLAGLDDDDAPRLIIHPRCYLLADIDFDLVSSSPCTQSSYLALFSIADARPSLFKINETMITLMACMAKGPMSLSALRVSFKQQYSNFDPNQVEDAFRKGIVRLNDIGAIRKC